MENFTLWEASELLVTMAMAMAVASQCYSVSILKREDGPCSRNYILIIIFIIRVQSWQLWEINCMFHRRARIQCGNMMKCLKMFGERPCFSIKAFRAWPAYVNNCG